MSGPPCDSGAGRDLAVPGMTLRWQIYPVASQEAFDVVALMWALNVANGLFTVVRPMASHYD